MAKKFVSLKAIPRHSDDGNEMPQDHSSSSASSQLVDHHKRRRVGVTVACNACRRKKIRCNGLRPKCSPCQITDEQCVYRDLQFGEEGKRAVLEVVRLINTISREEALNRLESLRSEKDAEVVLALLRKEIAEDTIRGLTNYTPATPSPADQFATEELSSFYPAAYPNILQIDDSTLEETIIRSLNQPAGDSSRLMLRKPSLKESALNKNNQAEVLEIFDWHPGADEFPSDLDEDLPRPLPPLCDERLRNLSISFWTSVPINDQLAARVISLYLETDHPLLGHFDADLFVSDLVSQKSDFCCSLLVNALLYWGCQMYSAFDKGSSEYAGLFCQQVESQWPIGRARDSVLRMAAAVFMGLAYLGQGRDHKVLSYIQEASDIGMRMGLFGVKESSIKENIQSLPAPMANSILQSAWGCFNWITFCSLFYRQPGIQFLRYPPLLPIPREDENDSTHLKSPQPPYVGQVFPHLCKFWQIMSEVCLVYYGGRYRTGDDQARPPYFAEFKYRELLAWSQGLPAQLFRKKSMKHHVLILHIWFHAAVLDLFRPLLCNRERKELKLKTFCSPNSTCDGVYEASLQQLKRLVLVYRTNYRSSTYTLLWHTALVYVANGMLRDHTQTNWYAYLLLCIYGYEGLRRSWRVADVIARALLAMMLRSHKISTDSARSILANFGSQGEQADWRIDGDEEEGTRATFMADMDLAMSHPEEARAESLAAQFEEIASLVDYTNIFDDENEFDEEGSMEEDEITLN